MFKFIETPFNINEYRSLLILLAVLLITILFYLRVVKKKQNLPPGPIGVPIFGYFPFLGKSPHHTFYKLSQKYGNVFSLYFGPKLVVVLNDWEAIKDGFGKTSTANRPKDLFTNIPNDVGFGGENGREWLEQRRFSMKAMKDIGFGRSRWEELVQEELHEVVELIKKYGTSPLDVKKFFSCTFTNNVMTLVFGERLPIGHPDTDLVSDCVDAVSTTVGSLGLNVYMPTLSNLLHKLGLSGDSVTFGKLLSLADYTTKSVAKRLKNKDSELDSFIDEYIGEIQRQKRQNQNSHFTERSLRGNILGLLVGGSETTRTSLNFLLIAMAEHLEVQKRVQEELDSVLGKDGKIKWSERVKIPYTYAVIMEGMRWKSIVPINTARIALEDTEICGYDVPKGTIILSNNWAVHNDPKFWNQPEKFIPERFLLDGGKSVNLKPESFVPFSYGKRACPGELIAMMEILLYFVTLMQKFQVLPQDGTKVKYDTRLGLTFQATNSKLRFIPRE